MTKESEKMPARINLPVNPSTYNLLQEIRLKTQLKEGRNLSWDSFLNYLGEKVRGLK